MAHKRSLNRVTLVGNVQPRDPEISHIPNLGKDVAKFTLVTAEVYMDKNNQWQESSEWHNVVAWGYVAKKIEKSVKRGSMLLVEGKIKSRKWQDKNGQDRKTVEIIADSVVILDKTEKQQNYSADSSYGNQSNSMNGNNDDNIQAPPEAQIDDDIQYDDPF
ncbi:MAG: single-stranded DNA-binding protein [Acidobacteriota bacterium]